MTLNLFKTFAKRLMTAIDEAAAASDKGRRRMSAAGDAVPALLSIDDIAAVSNRRHDAVARIERPVKRVGVDIRVLAVVVVVEGRVIGGGVIGIAPGSV